MKFSVFVTAALLPAVGAFQGPCQANLPRDPTILRSSGGGGFYSDPAQASFHSGRHPSSAEAPDATKGPSVSNLNKGTYERLNGYSNPVAVNPKNPFSKSTTEEIMAVPMNEAKVRGYRFPDPATNSMNPNYPHYPTSGEAPDATKAPSVSNLNKGTYERLNGYSNPVAVNPKNPFSKSTEEQIMSVPMNEAKVRGHRFPDPATHSMNPNYPHYPTSGQAPDATKAPSVSNLNKGTYERLNGYSNPVAFNPKNPFSKSTQEEIINLPMNAAKVRGYRFPDPANSHQMNPLASNPNYSSYPTSDATPDATKPPAVSTLNKGTYESLNGYNNPVAVNEENPFSRGF